MFFILVVRRAKLKLLSKIKNEKKYKRIAAVLIIALLTVLIELIFNIHSIVDGYDWQDISGNIQIEKEDEYEKYVIAFTPDKETYIKQLRLVGDFADDDTYTVKTQQLNDFDREETVYYWDNISTDLTESYTNIGKKVTNIEISFYKTEKTKLYSVAFSNRFEFNKYRAMFIMCVLTFLYVMLFEMKTLRKIEWYFFSFTVAFGMLIIIFAQPIYNAWDEEVHFQNVYSIASGKNVEWSEATQDIINKNVVNCNTKAEFAELRELMDKRGNENFHMEIKETAVVSYSFLAYIPTALFVKIGMLFNLSFSKLYMLGKIGNLLFYAFVMFWAIRLAKAKRLFLLFIAMAPTSVYLAASYTYDAAVFACVTLGSVLWCNEMFYSQKKYQAANVVAAILLFSVGCLSKAVYIPLILVMLLLPQVQNMKKKYKALFWAGILTVLVLVLMTFVLPVFSNTIAGNVSFGGDTRGGDTSVVRQLTSMLEHPWASIKLVVTNILQLDNFRNLGDPSSSNYFVGNLMFLNWGALGILSHKWAMLLIPVLFITLLYREKKEDSFCYISWYKVFITLIIMITVVLIWVALYLSFTPVGEEAIAGVQARYYLPLLYMAALLVTNRKMYIQMSDNHALKLVLASVNIVWIISMYSFLLQPRLL